MSPRATWWISGLGAAFLAYFGLLVYCEAHRNDPIGFLVQVRPEGMFVDSVVPNTAAWSGGLAPGDRIVSANGRRIAEHGDWTVAEVNLSPGRPLNLVVERGGREQSVTVRLKPAPPEFWKTGPGLVLALARLTQLATLFIAILVAVKRAGDPLAWLGAWLLASGAVFSIVLPPGIAGVWSDLPVALGLVLWVPFASSLAAGAVLFTFFATFPRPLFSSRWIWAAAWTPMLLGETQFLLAFVPVVYFPGVVTGPPDAKLLMTLFSLYTGAGLVALTLNYSRLRDVNDRRRVRSILPGSVIALLSGIVMATFHLRRTPLDMSAPLFGSRVMAITTLALLALPFSFAYAILRRRMFGLTTLLRQGVRYALARRVVLMAPVLLAAILIADAVSHYEQRVGDVLATRLTFYLLFVASAAFIGARRERWLSALDRRFFRERYNAQRIVHELATKLRESGTVEAVAPFLVAQLEEALHPTYAALMARAEGSDMFRSIASAPLGAAPAPIPARWKVVALARLLGGPVVLAPDRDWHLTHQLPAVERAFLQGSAIELMLLVSSDDTAADDLMLILGSKRSEEPYGAEDLDLLGAVTGALALVMQRRSERGRAAPTLEECPACGRCYESGTVQCRDDATPLEPSRIEHVVARRYRLERRVGEGGMSRLYRATDEALQRDVAVKVLRDEWMTLPDGVERFRREAQIAAGFSHPNVVTIFDFGLSGGSAFLVMELLSGETLRAEMRRRGQLPVARTLDVLRQLGSAIEAAHERGLIHRDLKPENVFLCTTGGREVAKVLDFGLSTFIGITREGMASSGYLIGTPAYMAPEQLRGEEPSPAWDLWALAVLTFETITGALPFAGVPGAGYTSGAIPMPGSWSAVVDPALRADLAGLGPFFSSALSLEPRERPASAQELVARFEDAATAISI